MNTMNINLVYSEQYSKVTSVVMQNHGSLFKAINQAVKIHYFVSVKIIQNYSRMMAIRKTPMKSWVIGVFHKTESQRLIVSKIQKL